MAPIRNWPIWIAFFMILFARREWRRRRARRTTNALSTSPEPGISTMDASD
jgi:hypothetical protein